VTGNLTDGTTFDSFFPVFNRDRSFYTAKGVAAQARKEERRGAKAFVTPGQKRLEHGDLVDQALADEAAAADPSGRVVPIVRQANGVPVSFYADPVAAVSSTPAVEAPYAQAAARPNTARAHNIRSGPVIKIAQRNRPTSLTRQIVRTTPTATATPTTPMSAS
jgi:hypothetical protein